MSSLYIHIPFCRSKCPYCSFLSWPNQEELYPRFVASLLKEAVRWRDERVISPLSTLFLGGGTPTALAAGELVTIARTCFDLFGLEEKAEISIEANPQTVDEKILASLYGGGFNRISLGAQSLQDQELRALGRRHSAAEVARAVRRARAAGFDNINLDLMYGLPGQSPRSWRQTLEMALEMAPPHLSLYELSIEPGTPFHRRQEQGDLPLPDDEAVADMDQITASLCRQAGLRQYEISNYARPGYECRHNINYWQNGEYAGLGAGAVACIAGRRQQKIREPRRYCDAIEAGESAVQEEECLDGEASLRETVVMGLRMVAGISRAEIRRRYGCDVSEYYGAILTRLADQGLLELTAERLRLTATGRRFANQVMADLV